MIRYSGTEEVLKVGDTWSFITDSTFLFTTIDLIPRPSNRIRIVYRCNNGEGYDDWQDEREWPFRLVSRKEVEKSGFAKFIQRIENV